jgi:hypothetical protein
MSAVSIVDRPEGIPGPQKTMGMRLVGYAKDPCVAGPPEKLSRAGANSTTSGD